MLSVLRLCKEPSTLFCNRWLHCKKPFVSQLKFYHKVQSSCKSSKNVLLLLSGNALKVSAGVGITAGIKLWQPTLCHADPHNRLARSEIVDNDPKLRWASLWKLLKPYLLELLAAAIAALACAYLTIQIPRLLGDMINVISSFTRESLAEGEKAFLKEIKGPAIKMVSLYGLLAGATCLYIHLLTIVGEGIAKTMKTELFGSLLQQDISFFDTHRTGELVNRLTVDINDFKSSFKMVVSQGLRNAAQIAGCSLTLLAISPKMTFFMLLAVPSVVVTATVLGSFLRVLSNQAKAQCSKLALVADEALANIRTVRAFSMEDLESQLFENEAEKCRILNQNLGLGIAFFQAGTGFFLNGMVLSTIYIGGRLLALQEISPGDLMAYLVALQMLQRSFTQLSLLFGMYIKGLHAAARVFEYSELETKMPLRQGTSLSQNSYKPSLEFRNVTFCYPTRPGKKALEDFNLTVEAGQTVALVGSSGSGKSTTAWLLERLYDPSQGEILLDGHDLKDLNQSWLRGSVLGLISQEPILFATTIRENIRYGRPGASNEEVEKAARLANAEEFINKFPDGYDTMVGERGVAVSGGQKQRIAIARALLKDPAILILDEATSALDSTSEKLVQDALEKVMKGRTSIVIAHRLSTIKDADVIVVLRNGTIVEKGTHATLMKLQGNYYNFVQQQLLEGKKDLSK